MTPASSLQRIAASMVDGVLFLPLLFIDRHMEQQNSLWLVFLYFLVTWQFGWLYTTLLHGWRGQTLGKLRQRIQLVRFSDGGPVSFKRAAVRELPYIALILASSGAWIYIHIAWWGGWFTEQHQGIMDKISSVTLQLSVCWTLLEFITMLFHPKGRALHDLVAGTMVIRKPRSSQMPTVV